MKKVLLSIALVLTFCTQSLAESSVWKVRKGGSVMYLGGTCHLLRQSDFPLPAEFDTAYKASDLLVFETDLGRLNDPAALQKLISKAAYADGSTIDKHLSDQTYRLLSQYCAASGIPLANLNHLKPSFIILTITMAELAKLGVSREGADTFLYQAAIKDQKSVQGLETIDEQIAFIVSMGKGNEDEFIDQSLRDLTSIKQDYEAMVAAWKTGDAEKLNEQLDVELKTKTPQLYKALLTDRNANWLPMIEAYHVTPAKEFILVGAAHLVGPDGIIEALRRKGYTVEKL